MPLVLSRSTGPPRPEDAPLIALRDAAIKRRSHHYNFSATRAAEIEKKQKMAYERKTRKPILPKPSKPELPWEDKIEPEDAVGDEPGAVEGSGEDKSSSKKSSKDGYSDPLWEPDRACWLSYRRSNSSEWKAWNALTEKWVNLDKYDEESGSSPTSSARSTKSDPTESKTKPKSSSAPEVGKVTSESEGDLPNRSRSLSNGAGLERKYSFKSVAQAALKVLAWRRRPNSGDKSEV